ncbi:AMP-binding protein [Humibacter ginsenosidimutans]|uniref:AMP-binding protein n=1 Tax=Humibacter ginsenosidimutans TaxID=2599293 RepID=UPI00349EAAAB
MPQPLLRVWHARGVALTQGYGLTEASPNVLCLPDEDAYRRAGSAGKPYPHVDVALADPVTGEHLDGVGRGELLVHGPGVFPGYFRDDAETALALRDGWLHTGDLVERDAEGYCTVVDRIKDIFISGGEGISPAEIENVLFGHPAVADAGVVGVPDEKWGEVGVAWVVVRPGMVTDEHELLAFAATGLARFKVPKHRCSPRRSRGRVLTRWYVGNCSPTGTRGRRTRTRGRHDDDFCAQNGTRCRDETQDPRDGRAGVRRARLRRGPISRITDRAGVAQGTFYLYFSSKLDLFNELVEDINRRVRHAMSEASGAASTRIERERAGFDAFFRFTAEHPSLYRIVREAEFVSPSALRLHYTRIVDGYIAGLKEAKDAGELGDVDPTVAAWALMGVGEMIGMRWVLWEPPARETRTPWPAMRTRSRPERARCRTRCSSSSCSSSAGRSRPRRMRRAPRPRHHHDRLPHRRLPHHGRSEP